MINVQIFFSRGAINVKTTGSGGELKTDFGRVALEGIQELREGLESWAASRLAAPAVEEASPVDEDPSKEASPVDDAPPVAKDTPPPPTAEELAAAQEGNDRAAQVLAELEAQGGISTTPVGITPPTPSIEDGGIKITGGDFDPSTSQPQPGDRDHVTDPNVGQDPVDSNPPEGEESAKSPEAPATAATAAGPTGPRVGGVVRKLKKP
jgi:hypothetical protein